MSFRIEDAEPLSLLRELPDSWAQACMTGPPPMENDPRAGMSVLAVVAELHRVTRPDGTLLWDTINPWLPLQNLALSFSLLGWQLQLSRLAVTTGHLLFTKQPSYYWHPSPPSAPARPLGRWRRRAACVPAQMPPEHALRAADLEQLLLAATSPAACSICGAPWRPTGLHTTSCHQRLRPGCEHRDPTGRCLVIDPFHRRGSAIAIAAIRNRRSYLGIDPGAALAAWHS